MAHTPGPWFVSADRIASDHGDIAAVHYQSSREQKGWHCMDDARLIAAAPYLLAALRDMVAMVEREYAGFDAIPEWQAAAAAIRKAEGK